MTIVLGAAYPQVVAAFARIVVEDRADGHLVEVDGGVVGSRRIVHELIGDEYFHPRPSAAGYDAPASSGSNLCPTTPERLDTVADRVTDYRAFNGVPDGVRVPVDVVTSSGSGLDPHLSPPMQRSKHLGLHPRADTALTSCSISPARVSPTGPTAASATTLSTCSISTSPSRQ
jgi:K+-transporting ATPase ATPase C chain